MRRRLEETQPPGRSHLCGPWDLRAPSKVQFGPRAAELARGTRDARSRRETRWVFESGADDVSRRTHGGSNAFVLVLCDLTTLSIGRIGPRAAELRALLERERDAIPLRIPLSRRRTKTTCEYPPRGRVRQTRGEKNEKQMNPAPPWKNGKVTTESTRKLKETKKFETRRPRLPPSRRLPRSRRAIRACTFYNFQ